MACVALPSNPTIRTEMKEDTHVKAELRLGTAGWNIPQGCKERVDGAGSHLERYARLFARIETRPLRLGLYFPLLNGWREWPAGERQMSLPI